MRCAFGVASLPLSGSLPLSWRSWSVASSHGSDGVRCFSPSALPTGWSSVELSSHGSRLRSGGSFYVHGALHVSALIPPSGPLSGGTRVSVFGSPSSFRESATMRCRFESSVATAAARVVGWGVAECASSSSSSSGRRRVEVSMNGQQFSSSGVSFTYRPACALSSVWPERLSLIHI